MLFVFCSLNKGKELKMSMDMVPKNQARAFGYVMADFADRFQIINWWSDWLSPMSLERREGLQTMDAATLVRLQITKISLAKLDNVRIFREVKTHMLVSNKLQVFQLTGIIIRPEGYQALSEGLAGSKMLRKFILQNCNVAEGNNFAVLLKGMEHTTKLELIDFQCSDLSDRHTAPVVSLIKEQYEMRDGLKWRLGLRN